MKGQIVDLAVSAAPGAPAKDAGQDSGKRRQIIEGARSVFLAQGYDRASMDEIARTAGVSKGTLYVYFDNKLKLFEALIIEDKRDQAEQMVAAADLSDPDIRAVLTRFGTSLARAMQRPQTVAMTRMVIAAAAPFPEIGRTLYANGPGYGIRCVKEYFAAKCAEGVLSMRDPELAAAQFLDLCLCTLLKPMLFNTAGPASDEAIEKVVTSAVELILDVYGAKHAERAEPAQAR